MQIYSVHVSLGKTIRNLSNLVNTKCSYIHLTYMISNDKTMNKKRSTLKNVHMAYVIHRYKYGNSWDYVNDLQKYDGPLGFEPIMCHT